MSLRRVDAVHVGLHARSRHGVCFLRSLPTILTDKPGEVEHATEQEQQPGGGDCLRRLRRLQSFRKRNACALIALPSASCFSGILREDIATAAAAPPPAQIPSLSLRNQDSTRRPMAVYRLNHLSCSLTPTVSCSKLDYTRPGYPSDAPPRVNLTVPKKEAMVINNDDLHDDDDDDGISIQDDVLFTRLVIPNMAPISIRNIDRHYCCLIPAGEHGDVADSLSIAHQRMGSGVSCPGNGRRPGFRERASSNSINASNITSDATASD